MKKKKCEEEGIYNGKAKKGEEGEEGKDVKWKKEGERREERGRGKRKM